MIIQHLVFGTALTSASTGTKNSFRHKSTSTSNPQSSNGKYPPTSGVVEPTAGGHMSLRKSMLSPPTSDEHVIKGKATSFEWEILGHEAQVIQLKLNPGSSITAETGALLEMSSTVEMDTTARGGFMSSFKRMFTGQGLFLTKFKNSSETEHGRITFCSPYISKILAIRMSEFGGELICKKNAFLCGDNDIEIGPRLTTRFSIGFFGGQGFILVLPTETMKVSTGCIVAFEPSIQYDIEWVKGGKNIFFGGEGLFLATLSGPGLVILQSLPFERLVSAIASAIPSGGGGSKT
eukprot:gene3905-4519_t